MAGQQNHLYQAIAAPETRTEVLELQGVSKQTLFNNIGTPGGPQTILRVGDHSKMLSNTFLLVRRTHLPIFIPFIDGFPQIMDQNLDHLSQIKSIADVNCLVCIRILYSKIFNNIHEKWFIQVDSFPISYCICTNFLLEHEK